MIQNDFPYFKKFESGWPIRDIIRVYLQNEHARARRDREAELACPDNSDSTLPKTSSNKTAVQVSFAVSEDEEEVPAKKKSRTFPKKKPHPVILSDAEESEGTDDLGELIASSGKSKDLKKTKPADVESNKENKPALKSKKRKAGEDVEDVISKKLKLDAPESNPKQTAKPKPKPTIPKSPPTPPPSKIKPTVLSWEDLPRRCPAAECPDKLPTEPIPAILSLFNKRHTLKTNNGPNAKGVHLIHLEICILVTREKRRNALTRLGATRNWPTEFDYDHTSDEIFALKPQIEELITNSQKLDASVFWEDFLLAINYDLANFCSSKTKVEFAAARGLRRCGYFGPQGEFVITSCLLRMVEELKLEDDDLDQTLFTTLHHVITIGKSSEQLECDDEELATSNYLTLDDFTHYVLLPFVTSALILQDLPHIDTLQDALFEKKASAEFGEFFSPEDDVDEDVHKIHHQNVKAIRGLQSMQESPPSPPPSSAPPRYRKTGTAKREPSLKIRIPPIPSPPEEKEITLADFPSPTSKKAAAPPRPKAKPKTKKKDSANFAFLCF
ncbi:hypothetical protein B0H16DRAFT_1538985 [Mycena metata]|uniref:Restriction of telomere capping protein 4 C-terminal domain-containing protein n=1 Tax=Mycena metata TaxID=1033252 RepID=A0AAD7J3E5_9AGAR|nr:hypothetical protein B0H16DRAFT_1538985 [Mycena metata]